MIGLSIGISIKSQSRIEEKKTEKIEEEMEIKYSLTSDTISTASRFLVNIEGLSIPIESLSCYEFKAVLAVHVSAVTTGICYGVNFSEGGAWLEASIHGSTSSTVSRSENINDFEIPTSAFMKTSDQYGCILINGIIHTGELAGNLTIQHSKPTSGIAYVFTNSFLKTTKIR